MDKAAVLDGGGHTATWRTTTHPRLRPGAHEYADATTRVASWLVRAATGRVLLPGAQQGLAETLGLTRVSVNRALRALAAGGLVRVEPGAVVVLAPEPLSARAANSV